MIDELAADIELALRLRYGRAKSAAEVDRTAAALENNGFFVRRAATTAEAKEVVLSLIPDGAEVLHDASQTLQLTGITEAIERSGATGRYGRESGAWTGRPRPMRSAAWLRHPT